MKRTIWRLRATYHLWRRQWPIRSAWDYSGHLSDGGIICYFREGCTPGEAIREDSTYWEG